MAREDRQITREEMQKTVDALMVGLKLPDPEKYRAYFHFVTVLLVLTVIIAVLIHC